MLNLDKTKDSLVKALEKALKERFGISLHVRAENLEIPPDQKLGDFAFPCFALAKEVKKAPGQIASELASALKELSGIQRIIAAGPYVNFFLSPHFLGRLILTDSLKKKKTSKEKVLIEYVSPNTNKPLHLGHVRNAVLGDSISRIAEYAGKKIIKTCLVNDRGIHICKSMIAYEYLSREARSKKHGPLTPQTTHKKGDRFVGDCYVHFEKLLKDHPALMDEAQDCLKKWEAGDKATKTLWKKMNSWVLAGMKETYKRLGISFDKTYFESQISEKGRDIILSQLKKGRAHKDETGAVYADLSSFSLPNKVLLRRDGTSLYVTQDIYLAVKKWGDYHATHSLYIVGSEQNLYLAQLFKVLELFGYPWAKNVHHLSYGMVNLPEGKMKSREGTVVDADDLLNELEELAEKEIQKRDSKLPKKEVAKRARVLALAAVKFFMLSVSPKSEMTFNPKESIAFQGHTGPYLLYTYARLKSILRKSGPKKKMKQESYPWTEEKQLNIQLLRFADVIDQASKEYDPSSVANYLYSLAQATNDYYHRTPVLGARPHERNARLALIKKITETLSTGLKLLGIPLLEHM